MEQIFIILEQFHNGKGKLSVTENCQLTKDKNIYIIDNSVFNFKK